ncbi:MAG: hypothetical protein KBS64_02850 [Treponema sp.]|nr:hypothetical protein [Candidatus Treponema equi]
MSSFPKIRVSLFLILSLIFISCSDDNPEVSTVDHKLVFDYKDMESAPEIRMSVYLVMVSDVSRGASMKILNEESGLEWHCGSADLRRVSGAGGKWAGCSTFVPVGKGCFPKGRYNVTYEDKAENECDTSFTLKYPDGLDELKASEFPLGLKIPFEKRLAIYSNEDVLLYFGEDNPAWETNKDIFAEFKNAWSKRVCYSLSRDSIYCLMPVEELGNEDFTKKTEEKNIEETNSEEN